MMRFAWLFALLLVLCGPLPLLAGDDGPRIVRYEMKSMTLFEPSQSGFKVVGEIASADLPEVPVPIAEISPRGYARIEHNGKALWLDLLDVDILPKEKVKGCKPTVGSRDGERPHGQNGIAEN